MPRLVVAIVTTHCSFSSVQCSENGTLANRCVLFNVHLVILFVGLDHDNVSYGSIGLGLISELNFVSLSLVDPVT